MYNFVSIVEALESAVQDIRVCAIVNKNLLSLGSSIGERPLRLKSAGVWCEEKREDRGVYVFSSGNLSLVCQGC